MHQKNPACFFCISGNDRMVEVGKAPLDIMESILLLKQGHPEQVTEGRVLLGFEYLQGWSPTRSLGNLL